MARNQSAFANWSQYLALRLATSALHTFSPQRNLASARGLGSILHQIDAKHRRRAVRNIARSLPHLPREQIIQIARGSMEHFLQLGVEVLFTTRMVQLDTWAQQFSFRGLEQALDLVLAKRPCILVTGHYGNWEILGYVMALLGIDLSAVARPIDNPLVNDWLMGVRQAKGLRIITKWGASDEMTSLLDRGGTLAFIGDQNAGDKGMFVPFFGRLASAYKSIGLLAIRYDAPVICGYARRVGEQFRFELGVTDIIHPQDWKAADDPLYYLTARYTRAIETMIRQSPEQYLWTHRRWKSRPRHERLGIAMPASLRRQLESLPWMTDDMIRRLDRRRAPVSGVHDPIPTPIVSTDDSI
jgi:KDO2-lipid IV(A) lauroyltransferase